MYDNNVTLKVEGKPIASGSLVIVNDRYGVKIDNVIADGGGSAPLSGEDAQYSQDENYGNESYENNEDYSENYEADNSANQSTVSEDVEVTILNSWQ